MQSLQDVRPVLSWYFPASQSEHVNLSTQCMPWVQFWQALFTSMLPGLQYSVGTGVGCGVIEGEGVGGRVGLPGEDRLHGGLRRVIVADGSTEHEARGDAVVASRRSRRRWHRGCRR